MVGKPTHDARDDENLHKHGKLARRNVLRMGGIAAAGVAAAAVTSAVSADPASASDGANLVVGTYTNTAENPTQLTYDAGSYQGDTYFGLGVADVSPPGGWASGTPAIAGYATGAHFKTAVQGIATGTGTGVTGNSDNAAGVYGQSTNGDGVLGRSTNADGVVGGSNGGAGVTGTSLTGTGVFGISAGGISILGETGVGNVNPAVFGESNGTGPGVRASGAVVVASTGVGAGNAAALDVHGRAAFTRSGVVTIPAGATNALTALVPGGLLSTSHVLATIQVNAGTVGVRAAVPILSGTNKGKIQVFLTGAAPSVAGGFKVAYLVIG